MLERLLTRSAASLDRVIGRALTGRSQRARARSKSESLGPADRLVALDAIEASYASEVLTNDLDAFFGTPRVFDIDRSRIGSSRRTVRGETIDVIDVRWASRVTPYSIEVKDRFEDVRENHQAAARLFLGRGAKRPAAILIHGYRGGRFAMGERAWPVEWLLSRGMDVALFVLPFHATRSAPGSGPRFPSSDPRFTNEGFRQAIGDLRDLVATLRARGAPHVAAMGMSLGGYTTSLLATIEPLDFAAPIIPLASFADIALDAGRFVGTREEQLAQYDALDRAHRIISPFTRPSKVAKGATIVVAGQGDRITPLSHAEKLAKHFEADLVTFVGGHILQFGRSAGFKAIGDRLRFLGISG